MAYVTAGTRLVYVAKWTESGILLWSNDVSSILDNVKAELQNDYALVIESEDAQVPALAVGTLNEQITLNLRTDQDRGSEQDILGNVDDSFARFGQRPDSSNFQSITAPGGTPQGTGAPLPSPQGGGGSAPSWWSTLTAQFQGASVGLLLGGAAVIGLFIYVGIRPAR